MLNAKLLVVGGDVKTTEIKLRLPAIIGRGKGSTITLLQPLVSRQHCELYELDGKLWVRDLGSLNGTYVNNEKISESELPPNELLTVGTVTFRAVYESQGEMGLSVGPVPQFLPSKAQQDDDQPTVRVDGPGMDDLEAIEEIEEVEGDGVPSTPLFETEPTKPAPSAPAGPRTAPAPQRPAPVAPAAPARPAIPAAVTTDVPAKPTPVAKEPVAEEEDDDLNDFLKSLAKK